jgi:radical SAM protein with 4Fe4S-binding SPASM domain
LLFWGEALWELIQQFDKSINCVINHHMDLYCESFRYSNTQSMTKQEKLKEDPNWTRCGFGRMPCLSLDGNVYPCFRMVPKHNNLVDSSKYAQGRYLYPLSNEAMLRKLNDNSCACSMKIQEKCENCKLFVTCPHCAADCVDEEGGTLTKTTSVCNFTRLQVYFARKY